MFTSATIPLDVKITSTDTANAYTWITLYDIDKNITLDRNYTDLNGNFYSRLEPNSDYMIVIKKNGYLTIKHPLKTSLSESPIALSFDMIKEPNEDNLQNE